MFRTLAFLSALIILSPVSWAEVNNQKCSSEIGCNPDDINVASAAHTMEQESNPAVVGVSCPACLASLKGGKLGDKTTFQPGGDGTGSGSDGPGER